MRQLSVALVAVALALAACHVEETPTVLAPVPPVARGPQAGLSRLVLYLNGPAQAPLEMSFDLAAVDAIRADGFKAPVLTTATTVNSLEIVGHQRLLAEAFLPDGRYTGLTLTVTRARVRREGKLVDLSLPAGPLTVPVQFEMRRGEATPLFATWDVDRAIENEVYFRAAFDVAGKAQELRRVLIYVTNEASDTLAVIDRQSDQVVSVVELGRGPKGLVVSDDVTRAYVVNGAAHTLSVIDINTTRVQHTTNLDVGAGSSDIALSFDGRRAYVTNSAVNSVTVLDTTSFQVVATIQVGFRPVAIATVPGRPLILVANTRSNSVSVIDTNRNVVTTTVQVEYQPSGFAFDSAGTVAFVSHLGAPFVSMLSLSSFRVTRTLNAGASSAALLEQETPTPRLFLSRVQAARVSLFDATLNTEIAGIPTGVNPWDLVLDTDREKLYVLNRGSDSVTVVDRNSLRVRATLDVGRRPYAMAIVP